MKVNVKSVLSLSLILLCFVSCNKSSKETETIDVLPKIDNLVTINNENNKKEEESEKSKLNPGDIIELDDGNDNTITMVVVNKDYLLKYETDFHSYPVLDDYFQVVPFYSKTVFDDGNLTHIFEGEYVYVIAKSQDKIENGYWYYIKLADFNYDGVEGWIYGNDDNLLMGTDERWFYEAKIKEKLNVLKNEYVSSFFEENLKPVVSELNKTLNTNYKFSVQNYCHNGIDWVENEKQLLSKYKDIVSKNKDELIFTLKNGKTVSFKSLYNPVFETDYKVYTLTRLDPERGFAVICVTYYENAGGILLNLNDGNIINCSNYELFDTIKKDYIISFTFLTNWSEGTFKINIFNVKNGNITLSKVIEGKDLLDISGNFYILCDANLDEKDVINFYYSDGV